MTFHPYPDFESSVACLDDKRLRRVLQMTKDILEQLDKHKPGDRLPPGAKMWLGYIPSLVHYGVAVCREMTTRGYNVSGTFHRIRAYTKGVGILKKVDHPVWLEMKDVHQAHRAMLLKKANAHFKQFKWRVKKNQPMVWPTKLKLLNQPVPHEWTLDELIKAGWHLRLKFDKKKKKFLAWFWTGPMEEVTVHKVYGLYCEKAEVAIRIAIRQFEREMA